MSLSARVIDNTTGAGLPGATISVDGQGIAIADKDGNFSIDNYIDGVNLTVSYVGYNSNTLPEGVIADDGVIRLTRTDGSLDVATVTAKIKQNPLPWILAGGGLILLLTAKKRSAMRGVGKIDTNTILLIGAGAVAVYLLTRPKTPVYPANLPASSYFPQGSPYNPYQQQNQVAQDITAGGGAAASILNAIANF